MNTLTDPTPMDFYSEDRRKIENDQYSDESLSQLEAQIEALDSNGPKEGEDLPPINLERSEEEVSTRLTSDGVQEDAKQSSWIKTGMDTLTFLTSPLQAIWAAGWGPVGHTYESDTALGKVGEALKVSGQEFMKKMFPEFGQEDTISADVIEKANLPDWARPYGELIVGIADPAFLTGMAGAKVIQKGFQAAQMGRVAAGAEKTTGNILMQGLHDILGPGVKVEEYSDLYKLAQTAESGDTKAIKQFTDAIEKDPRVATFAQTADAAEEAKRLKEIDEIFGSPNAPVLKFDENPNAQGLLDATLDSNNVQARAANINLSRLDTEEDLGKVLTEVSERYEQDFVKAAGKEANSETVAAAQNEMLRDLLGRKTTEFTPGQAYALRQTLISSAKNLKTLALKATGPTGSKLDEIAFEKALVIHRAIQEKATGVAGAAGRMLQSFKITAKAGSSRLREVQQLSTTLSSSPVSKRILKEFIKATDDPAQLNRLVNKSAFAKTIDALYEVGVNVILSGPHTHAVNIASNAVTLTMSPTKSFLQGLSAASRFSFREASMNFHEGISKITGVVQGIGDTLRLVTKGSVSSIGSPEALMQMHEVAKQSISPIITSENLQLQGPVGTLVDYVGRFIRLPGNALLAEDKAFKLINYRMEVNAQAAKRATAVAGNSTERRLMYNTLRNNPNENIVSQAIDTASYYTFTNALGKTGTSIHQAIMNTPTRVIIPFFKTPTNIVKMGIRNSVFGNVFKDASAVFKLGAEGDVARANVALGTLIPGYIAANWSDRISGHIDKKTPLGRFRAQKGVQPYSIKIGEEWVSYEKLEPLRSILGLYASYMDAYHNLKTIDPNTGEQVPLFDQVVSTAIAPTINTIRDNYMLDVFGKISYLIDGVSSGNPEYAMKQFTKIASSFTVPAFMRQINQYHWDRTYRIADTYMDQLKQAIPGVSRTLPAHRTLWGEEQLVPQGLGPDIISPISTQKVSHDPIDLEIIRLEVPVPKEPDTISINGIELELNPYQKEQFQLTRGKGIEGGPTLKETVAQFMTDPRYKTTPDKIKKDTFEFIFKSATESTKSYLFSADPELQQQYKEKLEARKKLMEIVK